MRSGRGQRVLVAHSRQREPRATVLSLPGCSCSPRQRPGAIVWVVGVLRSGIEGGGLPEERGELACDRDRDDTGGLASLVVQVGPALVQASLRAPGDLDHARVLAGLAAGERLADRRLLCGSAGRLRRAAGGRAGTRRW